MIKRILVVGGANGIGLAIACEMAGRETIEKVYVVDKVPVQVQYMHPKIAYSLFDLTDKEYSFFQI